MALRNILEDGDPILRKTCREVDQVTERTQMILDDMVETMRQAQGVGLAAPQVGIDEKDVRGRACSPGELYYFVNPQIVCIRKVCRKAKKDVCRFRDTSGLVDRPEKISHKGSWTGRENPQEFALEGFPSYRDVS